MLNRAEKETIVSGLKEDIGNARAIFLTNLIGITSNDSVKVRKDVRDSGGKVVITRNTLFQRAAAGTHVEKMLSDLKGPHAVAFAFEDAAGTAKALSDAGKELELIDLKAGFLGDSELSAADLKQLANLPSRDQMLATLLATFQAPVSAFARVMHAIKEQKEAGGEAPAEAAAEEKTEETAE